MHAVHVQVESIQQNAIVLYFECGLSHETNQHLPEFLDGQDGVIKGWGEILLAGQDDTEGDQILLNIVSRLDVQVVVVEDKWHASAHSCREQF